MGAPKVEPTAAQTAGSKAVTTVSKRADKLAVPMEWLLVVLTDDLTAALMVGHSGKTRVVSRDG